MALLAPIISLGALFLGLRALRTARLAPASLAEQVLYGAGLGHVLFAYGMLALGLLGLLTKLAVGLLIGACLALGVFEWRLLRELGGRALPTLKRFFRLNWLLPARLALLLWCLFALLGALAPPAGLDYDGLAHHLAVPKVYAREQQVRFIQHDHHSNFPYTVNMLFTAGLVFGSASAAKLCHYLLGLGCLAAVYVLGRRHLGGATGQVGALLLAATPTMGWLITVGYVDLGLIFYLLLATHALLGWMSAPQQERRGHLARAALMTGGALAVKMQAISFLGIVLLAIVAWQWRRGELGWARSLRAVGTCAGLAAILACPWYVKSFVWTGNPVFPFAHSVFGSRYWTEAMARVYTRHQKEFGVGDLPRGWEELPLPQRMLSGPRESWKWIAAPWNATMYPWHFSTPVNRWAVYICYAIGPAHLALLAPLVLLVPAKPSAVKWLLALGGLMFLGWFVLMQYGRYLLPCVALLVPAEAYAVERLSAWGRLPRVAAVGAVGLSAALGLGILGMMVAPGSLCVLGLETEDQYLRRASDVYPVCDYVNQHTTRDVTIALWGEPRGFYLDRDYFWAEPGHSTIVAYDRAHSGREFARELRRAGADYLLVAPRAVADAHQAQAGTLKQMREAIDEGCLAPAAPVQPRRHVLFVIRGVE